MVNAVLNFYNNLRIILTKDYVHLRFSCKYNILRWSFIYKLFSSLKYFWNGKTTEKRGEHKECAKEKAHTKILHIENLHKYRFFISIKDFILKSVNMQLFMFSQFSCALFSYANNYCAQFSVRCVIFKNRTEPKHMFVVIVNRQLNVKMPIPKMSSNIANILISLCD